MIKELKQFDKGRLRDQKVLSPEKKSLSGYPYQCVEIPDGRV